MKAIEGSDWRRILQALVDETDPSAAKEKVANLETALFLRGQELDLSPEAEVERKAMDDAIVILLKIKAGRWAPGRTGA